MHATIFFFFFNNRNIWLRIEFAYVEFLSVTNASPSKLSLSQTSLDFYVSAVDYKSFENTVGKGGIVCNEQFLLFPQCFLPVSKTFCHFHQIRKCLLQTLSVWKSLKFVVWERAIIPREIAVQSNHRLYKNFPLY